MLTFALAKLADTVHKVHSFIVSKQNQRDCDSFILTGTVLLLNKNEDLK